MVIKRGIIANIKGNIRASKYIHLLLV